MYLSRLHLNARHNRTRSEFDHPYEIHRTISKAWDELQSARVLLRADRERPGIVSVIVQSLTKPDWSLLDAPKDYLRHVEGPKEVTLDGLKEGRHLRFCLRCNPSKKVGNRDENDFGKRRALTSKDDIFGWLERKAETGGFAVVEAAFDRVYWRHSKGGIQKKPLNGVLFDGTLVVTDADRLRHTVASGIGPAKAFGFGLLSVAPV